uniref:Venom protein family 6 protein 1 n=1 Tax=Platymeris rhadamanthus TaxID=1134088 RepID=A0A6B9KZ39_PLARH|nr:venom protein family 6 protein 1 [Platymeris rhadamanthus]
MLKFVTILLALCVFVQASKVDELSSELDERIKIIDNLSSEQIKRAISIIVSKKDLAKEKGDDAVKCVEMEGNKYLQEIQNNNVESTAAFKNKINGMKEDLKNGKTEAVEKYVNENLQAEFEKVITNMQAIGETITLKYVAVANKCRGV